MRLRIVSYASVWDGRSPTATLESGTNLKLQMLHLVADLLVDRNTITELQRADGRIPGQPDARGKPERFERWLKSGIVENTSALATTLRRPPMVFPCESWGPSEAVSKPRTDPTPPP